MILGFLIIYAKFSDIFGRKIMLLSALLLFTIFSSACGAAQTLLQLCVLKTFEILLSADRLPARSSGPFRVLGDLEYIQW